MELQYQNGSACMFKLCCLNTIGFIPKFSFEITDVLPNTKVYISFQVFFSFFKLSAFLDSKVTIICRYYETICVQYIKNYMTSTIHFIIYFVVLACTGGMFLFNEFSQVGLQSKNVEQQLGLYYFFYLETLADSEGRGHRCGNGFILHAQEEE